MHYLYRRDRRRGTCIFNDFFREGDIVFERMFRAVDHDGSETAVDAVFAGFKVSAVVEVCDNAEIPYIVHISMLIADISCPCYLQR